jgi:RHS repeat-associated protein
LEFTYDPSGKRISKTVKPRANGILKDEFFWTTTFYVYDATGNVMAVYERSYQALSQFNLYKESVRLIEQHIYGSDRIGLRKCNVLVYEDVFSISAIDSNTHEFIGKAKPVLSGGDGTGNGGRGPVVSPAVHVVVGSGNHLAEQYQRTLGDKRYELKNHLGNVLSVITDRKIGVDNVSYVSGNGTYISAPSNNQLFLLTVNGTFVQVAAADLKVDYYKAEIVKSTEYSCYGVELNEWGYLSTDSYRYGFNGKELDKDGMGGGGSTYDYGFRIYNPALGKFLSVDPLSFGFAELTPFQYASNNPIRNIDFDGLEGKPAEPVKPNALLTTTAVDNTYAPTFVLPQKPIIIKETPFDEMAKNKVTISNNLQVNDPQKIEAGKMLVSVFENGYSVVSGKNFNNEEVNRGAALFFVAIEIVPGSKIAGGVLKKTLSLVPFKFNYSSAISKLVKSTGKRAEKVAREIITTTFSNSRVDALAVAREMSGLGDDAVALTGKNTTKFPNADQIVIGFQSADKEITVRIDWADDIGAHYNWQNNVTGESGAVLFEGTGDMVAQLKQMLTSTYK